MESSDTNGELKGRNLFVKFLGQKKRTVEKRISFFQTVDEYTKENDRKFYKNMNILFEI